MLFRGSSDKPTNVPFAGFSQRAARGAGAQVRLGGEFRWSEQGLTPAIRTHAIPVGRLPVRWYSTSRPHSYEEGSDRRKSRQFPVGAVGAQATAGGPDSSPWEPLERKRPPEVQTVPRGSRWSALRLVLVVVRPSYQIPESQSPSLGGFAVVRARTHRSTSCARRLYYRWSFDARDRSVFEFIDSGAGDVSPNISLGCPKAIG